MENITKISTEKDSKEKINHKEENKNNYPLLFK
jgi:hypothetical protein